MKVCGIVSEYNPFHNGHALHIEKTRELLGKDTFFICVMSGNYTQRGEPSLLPKHYRAEASILHGADLVIELPTQYTLRSAEGFARSAVYILDSLGVVTDLSFGAELSDTFQLKEIAELLNEHKTVQNTLLELKNGISYAAARERALYSIIKDKSSIISKPNNILAIEYIKSLSYFASEIEPHAIQRIGAEHDSVFSKDGTLSASAIRTKIFNKDFRDIKDFMPESSYRILMDAHSNGLCMTDKQTFERNMFSYLLRLSSEDFREYAGVSEGLEYRIFKALHSSSCIAEAENKIKSKRYPLSRIRRILLCAYLGINMKNIQSFPEYARVLAFNDNGRSILADLKNKSKIPLITKAAHINKVSESALFTFQKEALYTDLYYSSLPSYKEYIPGIDWRLQAVKL